MAVNVAACLAELVAMMLFVIIGCGTAMVTPDRLARATYSSHPAWILMVSFAFGFAITALAYSIGHISGGHINCAVTFGLILAGAVDAVQGAANLVSQLVGSVLGALILWSIFSYENDGTGGIGSNGVSPNFGWWNALIAEIVGTFILMFVVLQTAVNSKSEGNRAQACIAIGFAVFLAHLVLIHIDGCSINPTRSTGPALVASIRNGNANLLKDLWIFWVGPLVGAALAVGVYKFMDTLDKKQPSKFEDVESDSE